MTDGTRKTGSTTDGTTADGGTPEDTRDGTGSRDAGRRSPATEKPAETLGLLVLLEAKPGKEEELAAFLEGGRELAMAEEATVSWYAFRISANRFGIFDTFATEDGRTAHLNGEIAQALGRVAPSLLARDPEISPVAVSAVK